MNKIMKFIIDKNYRFIILANLGFFSYMNDEKYLKKKFKAIFGYDLDLKNPQSFNEKLQWLKIYDRKNIYSMMVDKYLVRDYISKKIGTEYLIPLLGVWDKAEDIDFDLLPNKFVLKCNHNSGTGMYICKDKTKMDKKKVMKMLNKGLKEDYYLIHREWPYRNVPRKIIAEKYMEEIGQDDLIDYKFMCFNGKHKMTFVCDDRFSDSGLKVTFYDKNWNILPFERHYPRRRTPIKKPINYERMVDFAECLSENIPFLRVDFYEVQNKIYFGELTFFPGSGYEEFSPPNIDIDLGALIVLPKI